ncbi:MAG: glycosyltransferase, partial [Candidatus Uhrbacteria bacterium]|nr:glycosyltransferase [Candidatus Uhrbacteria bacterium]
TLGSRDVSVIPPGIDLSRFAPREARLAADVPELLTVSRLVPEKGIDVLLEALSESLRPWRLTIVGDGPELPALRRRAEVLGILPRVRFAGAVADPSPFYRRADVFCFPSRSEGQGMALLEAAASRVPAVASDLPAIREAFGEDGVAYAAPGDVEGWRRSIERVLSRYPEALTRAERASRIVSQRYSLTSMVEAHATLYRGLTDRASV